MNRIAVSLLVATQLGMAVPQQKFRATTTRVAIDVAVLSANRPVSDLRAPEFALEDNGVQQTIEAVGLGEVPVDVSLVIDVSNSTTALLDAYRRDVVAISGMLRPVDRIRLIEFATPVQEALPLTAVSGAINVTFTTAGASSVYDAVATALMRPSEPGHRHLIVAFTDGAENASVLTGDEVARLATTSEAVLHVAAPKKLPWIAEPNIRPCYQVDLQESLKDCSGKNDPWLWRAVNATGGAVHIGTQLASSFQAIFKDFLNSYVLYYQPARVSSTGWHNVVVKVKRPGQYTVRARRGYFAG